VGDHRRRLRRRPRPLADRRPPGGAPGGAAGLRRAISLHPDLVKMGILEYDREMVEVEKKD